MRRKLCALLSFLAALLLLYGAAFTCLQVTITRPGYFADLSARFETGQAVGITDEEAAAALDHLVAYMEGTEGDIQMTLAINGRPTDLYTQDEVQHMEDVQKLYQTARLGRDVALIAAAVLFLFVLLAGRPRPFRLWAGGYLAASLVTLAGGVGLTIWATRDFAAFWSWAHRLVFTNELWLMDPATSNMIRLCPAELFQNILLRLGVTGGGVLLALLVLSVICLARRPRLGKREATPRAPKRAAMK